MLGEIGNLSALTCAQQSVMNFGILMVQGLVNSFGPTVMAAFAAAVKIDSFAYLPVQDFGNAYSTFVAQNYGAGDVGRIRKGMKQCFALSGGFCVVISALVWLFAAPLMGIFINAEETAVIASGVQYLRVEGAFYVGIGWLAPHLGETGIWMAIPIGWALADAVGLGYMRRSLHGLEPAAD